MGRSPGFASLAPDKRPLRTRFRWGSPPEAVNRRWTGKHAEAIYGSRAGVPLDYFHGSSTLSADGRTLYLFLDGTPNEDVVVKGLNNRVLNARVLGSDKKVAHRVVGKLSWSDAPGLLYLDVPAAALDPVVTVLALELDQPVSLFRAEIKPIESN